MLSLGALCLEYFLKTATPKEDHPKAKEVQKVIRKFLAKLDKLANQP